MFMTSANYETCHYTLLAILVLSFTYVEIYSSSLHSETSSVSILNKIITINIARIACYETAIVQSHG
jgi:hypothetical protein